MEAPAGGERLYTNAENLQLCLALLGILGLFALAAATLASGYGPLIELDSWAAFMGSVWKVCKTALLVAVGVALFRTWLQWLDLKDEVRNLENLKRRWMALAYYFDSLYLKQKGQSEAADAKLSTALHIDPSVSGSILV